MSIRYPVDLHVAKNRRRAKYRLVADVLLVLIFLSAITAIIIVHTNARQLEEKRKSDRERDVANAITEERRVSIQKIALAQEEAKQREAERLSLEANQLLASSTQIASGTLDSSTTSQGVAPLVSTSSLVSAGLAQETVLGFARFEDVTATRYENQRMGFVMEIPLGWSEVYARSEDVVLASSAYPVGTSLPEVIKKKDVMWIHVRRPCASLMATSTLFIFSTTTNMSIREASACVPPFIVTLGYRADANDYLSREQFLLSIGRTLYPIVGSSPPYLPIR